MTQHEIQSVIDRHVRTDGLTETGLPGLRLFRATQAIPCAPVVYEPCVVAIVRGRKEAVLDGVHHVYDTRRYLCCPMSLPVQAGTASATPEDPLLGVLITLDPQVMTELAVQMETAGGALPLAASGGAARGIKLARWDADFADALVRALRLIDSPADAAVLGPTRLRELCYTILKGEAGVFARQAFAAGNVIARSIAQVAAQLDAPMSIDEMARRAGMSRAVFHRRFKAATTMSPIQFLKSMRLNTAAVRIASGSSVQEAASDVGYVSPSQFSREFKRMYGKSPRQWSDAHTGLGEML